LLSRLSSADRRECGIHKPPKLIPPDLKMPEIRELEALHRVKEEDEYLKTILVVVITSSHGQTSQAL
jgi:CheY-like chemotaxis protein